MKRQTSVSHRRRFLKSSIGMATTLSSTGSALFAKTEVLRRTVEIPSITLNNGIDMPILGFGTNTLNGDLGEQSVADAISVGYRLIDTAHIYGNEEAVGKGIEKSGIDRKALFVTSKLWVDDAGYENTLKAFDTSIKKLGLNYLDLYLIHRPKGDIEGSWKAMEELYNTGKIKAIGVSNFEPNQLDQLKQHSDTKPVINQIESNAFFQQKIAYPYLKNTTTQMQAWSPFAAGRNGVFDDATLASIGQRLGKTNAQVCLRWQFQRGVIAIPRSSQKRHMIENLNIFDFELSEADMQIIAGLDQNTTQFPEWA